MALIPSAEYPAQIDTGDAGYPHGKARNASSYQDGTGTPLEAGWINDVWGFLQALLAKAEITPSGDADKVGASQYLDALLALTNKTQTISTTTTGGNGTTITLGATTAVLRIHHTVADSYLGIAGFTGGWPGRRLRLFNVSEVHSFVQLFSDSSLFAPVAANRLRYNVHDTSGGITINEDMGTDIWYDGDSERWRPLEQRRLGIP